MKVPLLLGIDEAQKAFVKNNFRSSVNESFDAANAGFVKIEMPFTVHYFGGWKRAYPDVIDAIYRKKVKGE